MNVVEKDSLLEVRCSYFALGHSIKVGLEKLRLSHRLILIIDAPFGFAMSELPKVERKSTLIVTDSPCPEYWNDLWQMRPLALLVKGTLLDEIQKAIEQAARGGRFRRTPDAVSILNQRERDVLRCCAMGLDNKEIADTFFLKERTVANHIYKLKEVLELRNRNELALYYWGQWHWLDAYRDQVEIYISSKGEIS